MANYKLTNDYWETSGVYDITQGKTQREINAAVAANTGANDPTVNVKTATGDIATFDGAEGVPLKNLTVNIEPLQSGSGDPSPTNVRPITGWTGANVAVADERIYGDIPITQGGFSSTDGAASTTNYRIRSLNYIEAKPNTEYTVYFNLEYAYYYEYDESKGFISSGGAWKTSGFTFRTQSTTKYFRFAFAKSTVAAGSGSVLVTPDDFIYCNIIENGKGSQYSISFPAGAGTVYGGTLDVTNGVLTVDMAKKHLVASDFTSFYDFYRQASGSNLLSNAPAYYNTEETTYICDTFKPCSNSSRSFNIGNFATLISNGASVGFSSQATTLDGFKALIPNGIDFVYQLATPITYTLTPIEVKALLGTNNVWADCGDVDVEYGAYLTIVENQLGERIPKVAVAPIEKTTTASKAYAVNEMFFMGDKLYIATAPIASGATFTVGTNCDETTLGEQIAALLNA